MMKPEKDITVIIPLHVYDDEAKTLLETAINSVPNGYPLMIACSSEVAAHLNDFTRSVSVVDCGDESSFASLVNMAVNVLKTTWFSILEYDDTYTKIYFDEVENYVSHYPEVSVFGVLEDLTDFNTKKFIGYGNEATWASSFSNEMGYIDNDCLQEFFDFYLTGSLFNAKDWAAVGGLKPSIKVTFWYEFLLRLTDKNKKVFIIPKVGYNHMVDRQGSLYAQYRDNMSEEETKWWFDLAKQEYFYTKDRNKVYEPQAN